jgi:hypothetical protein
LTALTIRVFPENPPGKSGEPATEQFELCLFRHWFSGAPSIYYRVVRIVRVIMPMPVIERDDRKLIEASGTDAA